MSAQLDRLAATLDAMRRRPFLTSQSGAFLRNPHGGVEDVADMKAAGLRWLAVNVGDHEWEEWRTVITRGQQQGVDVFPWARCWNGAGTIKLLELAEQVAFRCILNIEDEFEGDLSPDKVAAILRRYDVDEVGISSVGWLYNDVDFMPVSHLPMLLQLFPQDMRFDPVELETKQRQCVTHARDKGFKYVGVTFQTYGGAEPGWYAYHAGTRSLYTGDDVGGQWAEWAVT